MLNFACSYSERDQSTTTLFINQVNLGEQFRRKHWYDRRAQKPIAEGEREVAGEIEEKKRNYRRKMEIRQTLSVDRQNTISGTMKKRKPNKFAYVSIRVDQYLTSRIIRSTIATFQLYLFILLKF